MKRTAKILESLRKLSQLDEALRRLSSETREYLKMQGKIEALRSPLPTSILSHYDKRKARGKLAVAPVHRGVCGACHLSIPSGHLSDLRRNPHELNVCDNCGAFIYLAESESAEDSDSRLKPTAVRKTLPTRRTYVKRRDENV
jgi:predicted  nucleic acid-binding Zn-ribbon protein